MIGVALKLIIFTSMVNRIINTSRNERVTQQIYETYLQMFDVCTLRHTAHIEAIVQFLPYSAQQVRCDVCRVTKGAYIEHLCHKLVELLFHFY